MQTQPANQAIVDAIELRPAQESNELKPDSIVTIMFRGGPPVVDKYDSRDYVVPPIPRRNGEPIMTVQAWQEKSQPAGYFKVRFDVAEHLRNRAIVPGTRNPHTGKAISQIAIVLTPNGKMCDPEQRQTPFTAEQLQQWGCPEGLDRSMFEDGRKNVTVIPTESALMAAYRNGTSVDGVLSAEHDPEVTAPPADHEGLREAAADERAAAGAGVRASTTRRGQTRFRDDQQQ